MARLTETKTTTPFESAYERCTKLVERLTDATGIKWTFGYIGNLDAQYGDDRCWFAFAEHPGRVGTDDDRIGGVSTDNLEKLVSTLAGALALTRVLNVHDRRGKVAAFLSSRQEA